MNNIAILSKDFCPYCKQALKAMIKYHIYLLHNSDSLREALDDFFYLIFTNKFDTYQNHLSNFEGGTPAMLIRDVVYTSILNSKLTEDFLKYYRYYKYRLLKNK